MDFSNSLTSQCFLLVVKASAVSMPNHLKLGVIIYVEQAK
ncbi:unnamed protein product [marine sediment metagenome]|uniref:Uncharacterized protein n=1 Tax=marine sediment metagenome TaxID=412755 RepID=X1PUQ9_9ZZZZ